LQNVKLLSHFFDKIGYLYAVYAIYYYANSEKISDHINATYYKIKRRLSIWTRTATWVRGFIIFTCRFPLDAVEVHCVSSTRDLFVSSFNTLKSPHVIPINRSVNYFLSATTAISQ